MHGSQWNRAPHLLLVALCGCPSPDSAPLGPAESDLDGAPWARVEAAARGRTVHWAMWQGDPFINEYVDGWVKPRLKERFDIELQVVSSQGNDIVSRLMTELEAGPQQSEYDIMWINGETFYQLRQIDALHGPFTSKLPNARFVDFENPFIGIDFQQPIEGMECPWGNVQLALIYDSALIEDPPRTPEALEAWVRAHPGRFTFDTDFTGLTFLKSLLIHFAGGPGSLHGPFDPELYAAHGEELWEYIRRLKPFLWKEGRTFPSRVSQLHQLFIAGEIDFTMSNNDGEVDNKVLQGLFPDTARAYVLETGTVQNTHYIGIAKNTGNLAAALVTINFLISPEAQFQKTLPSVWGDGTILALRRLPQRWRSKFKDVPQRTHAPSRASIRDQALMEPASEYMIRMFKDLRTRVIER
ncbi:MAG: ABC transporter substrate-binding protein [Myxococcota bacterium]